MAGGLLFSGGAVLSASGVGAPVGIGLLIAGGAVGGISATTAAGAPFWSKISIKNSAEKTIGFIEKDLEVHKNLIDARKKYRSEYDKLVETVPKGILDEMIKDYLREAGTEKVQRALAPDGVIVGLDSVFDIKEAGDFVNIVESLVIDKGYEAATELREKAKELNENLNKLRKLDLKSIGSSPDL